MGKESLIKSTAKLKTATSGKVKKTTQVKKSTASEKPKKKKAIGAPTRTTAGVKRPGPTSKRTASAESKTQKTPATAEALVHDPIMKPFEPWKPENLYRPPASPPSKFSAPPFFKGSDDREITRLKNILFRRFDLKESPGEAVNHPLIPQTDETPPADFFRQNTTVRNASEPPDPIKRMLKYAAALMAVLMALTVGASFRNHSKFYIKAADGAVSIWRGQFSPMGEELLISLPGAVPPESVQPVYSKEEAFSIAFNYYMEKADSLLGVDDIPDFQSIKSYLNKALPYAFSEKLKSIARGRLNTMTVLSLVYRAEVAAGKNRLADLESALQSLEKVALPDLDPAQANLIQQKIQAVKAAMASLKAEETETEAKAAESGKTP